MKSTPLFLILIPYLISAQSEIVIGNLSINNSSEINVTNTIGDRILYLNRFSGDVRIGSSGAIFYNGSLGRVGINTTIPQSKFHIAGNTDASLTTHGLLMLGFHDQLENLVLDNNEIMARNNGSASTLYFNRDGGNVEFFGAGSGALIAHGLTLGDFANMQYNTATGRFYYDGSSRRYKENITPLQDDWTKILQLQPVTYNRPGDPDRWEYGYIAEEIDSIGLTTMVGYNAEGKPEDVRYDKMILYLVEMLKIQQEELKLQQQKLEIQQQKIDILEEKCEARE